MKAIFCFTVLLLLFITTECNAQQCKYNKTRSSAITPRGDTLNIESLTPIYNKFDITWAESSSNRVEVTIKVCSEHQGEFDAFIYFLGHINNSVNLLFNQSGTVVYEPEQPDRTSGVQVQSTVPRLALLVGSLLAVFTMNKRYSWIVLCIIAVLFLNVNVSHADSLANNQTTLNIRIAVPTSMNKFCVQGECFTRDTAGPVTNYVSLFGKRFAALDSLYGGTCDPTRVMQVPTGWQIVRPSSDRALLAIAYNDWKTFGLVISDGTVYENLMHKVVINVGFLVTHSNYFGEGIDGYSVKECDTRILISQDFPIPESVHEILSTPHISHFITYNGFDYAAADNTPPQNTGHGCQTTSIYLSPTSEWSLAPDDGSALVATHLGRASPFGTDCIVVENGKAYALDLETCAADAGIRKVTYKDGIIYTLSSCNRRLMLRRPTVTTGPVPSVITNHYVSGDLIYATLDNASPSDATIGACQSTFMVMPPGWRLASVEELNNFAVAANANVWPSTTCLVTEAAAVTRAGAVCESNLVTKVVAGTTYYHTLACSRVLMVRAATTGSTFTIGLRILLISVGTNPITDVALNLARAAFNATGAAYDWINLLDSNQGRIYPGDLPLMGSDGNPKYYAIVLTDGQLTYVDANTNVGARALTDAQRSQLDLYKYTYGVRVAALTSYPDPALGVSFESGGAAAPAGTFVRLDPAYASANPTVVSGLQTTAAFDLAGAYYVTVTTAGNVTPLVRVTASASEAPTTSSKVVAVIITRSDSTQEMHFFLGNSVTFAHGPYFANLWLNWVTKGIWIGNRRVYFIPQVDDLFLSTEDYADTSVLRRMNGDDLRKTKDFLAVLPTPAGSNVTLEFGFNGAGVRKIFGTETISDDLYDAVRELRQDFFFESHTFTHLDLTCPLSDCALYGATTYEQANSEIYKNIVFTRDTLFAEYGGLDMPTFSKHCMITPKITGLFNPNALKAMIDNGIECVVGDNSVASLIPPNLYHGIVTTVAKNGYDGVFIIPRAPTEIYFDVALPEEEEAQFNARYGIGGRIIPSSTNKTLDFILNQEADRAIRNLVLFRHDPYMFHQSNLVHFEYTESGDSQSKDWSLLTLWMQTVVEKYNTMLTFPMLNVKHDDLWELYKARMARDACGISGSLTVSGGVVVNVAVTGTNTCEASVTGIPACSYSNGCRIENYGGDNTLWAQITKENTAIISTTLTW